MAKFIGDPANVHIHDEGRRAHFKRGKDNATRYNFDTQSEKQMDAAIKALKSKGWGTVAGYAECVKWFKKLGYE